LLRQRVSFQPQNAGGNRWIDAGLPPPSGFITTAVNLAMVTPAQRDGKFVADLSPQRSALCEAEVMSIRGLPAADQTGWVATNLTCSRSRTRRGSGNVRTLLSIAVLGRLRCFGAFEFLESG
jgi:hypothetical protein